MATKVGRPAGPLGAKTSLLALKVTPKTRFGLEMLSRLRNTSVPDLVTFAIDDLFRSEGVGLWEWADHVEGEDIPGRTYLLDELWDELPSNRFANVALRFPKLASLAERALWEHVKLKEKYWSSKKHRTEKELLRDVLAVDWAELSQAYLPKRSI